MQRFRIMKDEATDPGPSAAGGRDRRVIEQASSRPARSLRAPLIVGAMALTGVGLGLMAVIAGSFLFGLATEAFLAPTLLAKVAGGLAGGGVGMAKGVNDVQRRS